MQQNKGQMASVAIVLLIVSNAIAVELVFLGGLSISDFSMETHLPEEIDFNDPSATSCMILRTSEWLNSSMSLGIECFVPFGSYEWECESDFSSRIQKVGDGNIELCLRWSYLAGRSGKCDDKNLFSRDLYQLQYITSKYLLLK